MGKKKLIIKTLFWDNALFWFGVLVFFICLYLTEAKNNIGWLALGVAQFALIRTIPRNGEKKNE